MYLVSISAVRELSPGRIEVWTKPVMIYRENIREAAATASAQAFQDWPIAKGYSLHRANVCPLGIKVWQQISGAMHENNLNFNPLEDAENFACQDFLDELPENVSSVDWPELIG